MESSSHQPEYVGETSLKKREREKQGLRMKLSTEHWVCEVIASILSAIKCNNLYLQTVLCGHGPF